MKNFTVIVQPTKNGSEGIFKRLGYLTSTSHSNHRTTERIVSLYGNDKTMKNIALNGENYILEQKMQRKRGRPLSSFAVEFCLTLPKPYRPSEKQWKLITRDCVRSLSAHMKLSKEEKSFFYKQVRAVLHQQDMSIKSGTRDHVHLILSKVLGTKRILTELQQKKALKVIKVAFNAAVLMHANIDHRSYIPKSTYGKRIDMWKFYKDNHESNKNKLLEAYNSLPRNFDTKKCVKNRKLRGTSTLSI